MPNPKRFLIVDDVTDSRALVVRTLLRKFPSAIIEECQEPSAALVAASSNQLDFIISHRAFELDGITLVQMLRKVNPNVPILMISGIDRRNEALAAGATAFHNYDEWLRIGTVIYELLLSRSTAAEAARSADEADREASAAT